MDSSTHDTFDGELFNRYALLHHSTGIEGSSLTESESYLLLQEGLTPANKPLIHSLMLMDHKEALDFVLDLADRREPITVVIIKQIAAKVMKSTGSRVSAMAGEFDLSKGDFRLATVRAGTSTFMDYKKVPAATQKLCEELTNSINRVEGIIEVNKLAFDVHYQLVTIHPFGDGNGRTARLLMNYVQRFHGMPLSYVDLNHRQLYFDALTQTREAEDPEIFRSFMFEELSSILTRRIESIRRKPSKRDSKGNGITMFF